MTEERLQQIEYVHDLKIVSRVFFGELIIEVRRLRVALRQYGSHDLTCRFDGITCRCGFSEALQGGEGGG